MPDTKKLKLASRHVDVYRYTEGELLNDGLDVGAGVILGVGNRDGNLVTLTVGNPVGGTDGDSVLQISQEPGQWYIDSSIAHLFLLSLAIVHEHSFRFGDMGTEVIVNLSVEEKSSQHVPHILGQ